MRHLDEGTLQSWLDRDRSELTPLEREEIGLHLAGCAACRRRLEEAAGVSRRASALLDPPDTEAEEIPPYAEVVARARSGTSPRRRRSPWAVGGWAASIAIAVGAGWMANAMIDGGRVGEVQEAPEASGARAPETQGTAAAPADDGPAETAPGEVAPRRLARSATQPASPTPSKPLATRQVTPPATRPTVPPATPQATRVNGGETAETPARPNATVLEGRVTDEDDRPLQAAQVFVPGTGRGALTDAQGRFQIDLAGVPDTASAGLTVTVALVGYATASRAVSRDDSEATLDFRLPQQALALDELVVTGVPNERNPSRLPVAQVPRGLPVARIPNGPPEIVLAPGGDEASWIVTDRADAEKRAGFDLLTVPGLRILRIQVQVTADVTLVRVVQELPGGDALDLVEARETLRFDPAASDDGRARASLRREGITVAGAAPGDPEALRAWLERVR